MTENPDSRLGSIRNIIANIKGTKTGKALLSTRTAQLGKAGRFAVFQVKLWSHCIRLHRTLDIPVVPRPQRHQ